MYTSKEKKINEKILKIVNEISEYQYLEQENNHIANQLEQIENMINVPLSLKEFDREAFDSIVDKIIVGVIDDNGNINSDIIRLVLKIGTEYRYDLTNKLDGSKIVSYDGSNRYDCS